MFRWYILSYVEQNSLRIAVQSSLLSVEKSSIKNSDSRKVSSIFVSDTISMPRLLPKCFTTDSNLFVIEFMLI